MGWRLVGFQREDCNHQSPCTRPRSTIASVDSTSADVGESIPIRIEIANTGNVHASDIEVILCEYDDDDMMAEIRKNDNMCDEDSIVMRQIIGALDKPDDSQDERVIETYMLYPVTAGSKNVYVVVDPGNTIVEANEGDNIVRSPKNLVLRTHSWMSLVKS